MKKLFYLLFFCCLLAGNLHAQDLIYQPVNPAFGGDTFNYQWLQSSAQAQDKTTDPNAQVNSLLNRSPLDDFEQNLNRQILNQLSRQLVASQFGEDALEPGSYTVGSYEIDVTEGGSGVNIVIVDIGTGDRTTVTIPYF
ncbi:curli production assembly/transport component CsgF [Pontibacter diazotrophicus]|uniref:Curli production assembly/transport component CsgF n=1 Tax=Pontibacter diazotrophicus TaxID=1400979 RepID=A0A3D8LF72_9BACT|nr:curli production assembly/transport component CsgF [Pontibacter diazotrophicus]RDV16047.1 curli production assembly/transport component CsgF [Pontibacter diazotrophicus]